MTGCCAVGCSNRSEQGFKMKVFPKDPQIRAIWESMVKRLNWKATNSSFLCEEHFDSDQWEETTRSGKRKLKPWAVPTLFSHATPVVKRKLPIDRGQKSSANLVSFEDTIKTLEKSLCEANNCIAKQEQEIENLKQKLTNFSEEDNVLKKELPRKEELAAIIASQPDATSSSPTASAPTDVEEPPPKVPKISKPNIDKIPAPSLIVEGPRQRKVTRTFPLDEGTGLDYVLEGFRLVNMSYFLKNLMMLNDHNDRKCNFSNMRICGETKADWNVGIEFACRLCPTTKVVWMEDPDTEEPPPLPIIIKPPPVPKQPNFVGQQTMNPQSLLRAPTTTVYKTQNPVILPKMPTAPPTLQIQKPAKPPSDNEATAGHILPQRTSSQVTMQLPKYPNTILLRPNTTLLCGPSQTSFSRQMQVQPILYHQVPASAQSQLQVVAQSQGSLIGQTQFVGHVQGSVGSQSQGSLIGKTQFVRQVQGSVGSQSQGSLIGQTQVVRHLQGSVGSRSQGSLIGQTQVVRQLQGSVGGQTQVSHTDFPQAISIKQEVILPDDGVNPSFLEPQIQMTFCVEQSENSAESGNVPCDTNSSMNVTKETTTTPDGIAHPRPSLSSDQLSSSTAMDVTDGIIPTDILQVDLNLVKKEVDDET